MAWGSPAREEKLEAYIMTYLKEEVQAEALVRNLPGFARFIAVAALFHGQAINAANIARDSALRCAGRFNVRRATPSCVWCG